MIKKDLLAMRGLQATNKMREMVREDTGIRYIREYTYHAESYYLYKYYQYFAAIVQRDILKIAVFERKHIEAGCLTPEYEIYISKAEGKWLTYAPGEGKWKTAKIDNLSYDIDKGHWHGNYPWSSKETQNVVNTYLETENLSVKDAVLRFQNEMRRENVKKKNRSITERIDGIMAAVPELPKDFNSWIIHSAFCEEKSLFYHAGTRNGYCTACESEVKLKMKPYHNIESRCPACKKKVTLRAWKKQKYVTNTKRIGILQRLTDKQGYVIRLFQCKIRRTRDNDWGMIDSGFWEMYRILLDNDFRKSEWFEWGEFRNTGIDRWNRPQDINKPSLGYFYREIDDECILYHRNLWRIRKDTFMKYIPWEKVLASTQGHYCHPIREMRAMREEQKIEYLIKSGLLRLAKDAMENRGPEREPTLDYQARKPWDMLKVSKEQFKQCIRMNISNRELRILQIANLYRQKITPEQLRYMSRFLDERTAGRLFRYGHLEHMVRYIKEELKGETRQIGDYVDYLDDLEYLKLPISKGELFPKNFQVIHHNVAVQRQEKENKIQEMQISEKNMEFKRMLPEIQEVYSMENDELTVVFPTCKEDFQVEGRANHNCVGGSYFDRMLKRECVVFFLRKKENIMESFCTVEMRDDRIVQCKTIYNREAPPEAMEFMRKLSKEVAKRLQKKHQEQMEQVAG